jgi:hypothetical protein
MNPLAPLVKPVESALDPLKNLGAGNALLGAPSTIISQADAALLTPLAQDNIGKRASTPKAVDTAAGILAEGADVLLAPAEVLDGELHHVAKDNQQASDVEKRFYPFFLPPPPLVVGAIVADGIADGITRGIVEGSRDSFDRDDRRPFRDDRDDRDFRDDRDDRDFRDDRDSRKSRDVEKRFLPLLPPPPLVAGAIIADEAAEAFERAHRRPYYDDRDYYDDGYY